MSIQCPHCKGTVNVGTVPYSWLDRGYGVSCVATTSCCGHAVVIRSKVSYVISAYEGSATEDDWGSEILPLESSRLKKEAQAVTNAIEMVNTGMPHLAIKHLRAEENFEVLVSKVLAQLTDASSIQKLVKAYTERDNAN